mmetsp:Transcript_11937/g.13853  ORF Transcript_11937/g.13853 Transcript_11937/m.13853 type:complete len:504 (-) Transcript_11937:1236-2747(-)|eukprot:CAMPEP_0204823936 /NCGR_PEP_ID=MMETSP1346-20131115/2014_1 /ASSEMBLY_ACC=CAM_ASM_000771 /TAXON_ID=215587 /ORGANISM="Aplanochytrium stocchinoi, Strain GSBS06" /LENGTH=503 /DNA_ID=CAMNT_0051950829 /DNA_START=420 /DNA_END=1931 /DNA_ORIENTATION=-
MDDAPILDGDDDLLDYFFSDELGQDFGRETAQDKTNIDQVNDSMASLLFSPDENMNTQSQGFLGLEGEPMMFDTTMDLMPNSNNSARGVGASAPASASASAPSSSKSNSKASSAGAKAKPRAKAKSRTKASTPSAKVKAKPRSRTAKTTDDIGNGGKDTGDGSTTISSKSAMKVDSTGNAAEDKRLRRLARNRESARQSRRRKKEHLELLEEKVAQLTNELDDLRRQYMEQAEESLYEQRLNHLANLNSVIEASKQGNGNDGSVQNQIREGLEKMEKLYGPNSEEQNIITEYHYKHLFSLILPTYSKYFVWMLNQGERFFDEGGNDTRNGESKDNSVYSDNKSSDPKSVWKSFCGELHLTIDQQEKLKSDFKQQHAEGPRMERQKLSTCINILEQLRSRLTIRSKVVATHSRALCDILTPEQTVKYLLWSEENRERISQCQLADIVIQAGLKAPGTGVKNEAEMGNNRNQIDTRLQAAAEVLQKPETEMQLEDLKILLAALDG